MILAFTLHIYSVELKNNIHHRIFIFNQKLYYSTDNGNLKVDLKCELHLNQISCSHNHHI